MDYDIVRKDSLSWWCRCGGHHGDCRFAACGQPKERGWSAWSCREMKLLIQVHIDIQKCDSGRRGVSSELDGIAAVETFRELSEGVGTMRPEEKEVIDETQLEVGLFESGVNEILSRMPMNRLA